MRQYLYDTKLSEKCKRVGSFYLQITYFFCIFKPFRILSLKEHPKRACNQIVVCLTGEHIKISGEVVRL